MTNTQPLLIYKTPGAPVACDMTTATDTPEERVAEYGHCSRRRSSTVSARTTQFCSCSRRSRASPKGPRSSLVVKPCAAPSRPTRSPSKANTSCGARAARLGRWRKRSSTNSTACPNRWVRGWTVCSRACGAWRLNHCVGSGPLRGREGRPGARVAGAIESRLRLLIDCVGWNGPHFQAPRCRPDGSNIPRPGATEEPPLNMSKHFRRSCRCNPDAAQDLLGQSLRDGLHLHGRHSLDPLSGYSLAST
jgi:hypothetical protein